jgi:chromosome condensin MukBEF MukE localization factor
VIYVRDCLIYYAYQYSTAWLWESDVLSKFQDLQALCLYYHPDVPNRLCELRLFRALVQVSGENLRLVVLGLHISSFDKEELSGLSKNRHWGLIDQTLSDNVRFSVLQEVVFVIYCPVRIPRRGREKIRRIVRDGLPTLLANGLLKIKL